MTDRDAAIVCGLRETRTMFDERMPAPEGRLHSSQIGRGWLSSRFGDATSILRARMDGIALRACSDMEHDTLGSRMLLSLRTGDAASTGGSRDSQRCRDEV